MESMAQLLDGKIAAQKILDMVREGIVTSTQFNFRKPGLAVIVVGDRWCMAVVSSCREMLG